MKEVAALVRQAIPLTVRGDVPSSAFPRQYKAESLDISLHLSHSGYGSSMLIGILTRTPYRILCNGELQKSLEARAGLALTHSRFTPLHKIRYGVCARG
jgi:hypothetical protein